MCVCERYLVIPFVAELNRCPTGVLIWQSTHVSRCKKHYSGANSDAWKRANNTFLKNTAALGWSLNCVLLHYCKSLISRRMPLKSPKLWIFNTGMWENYEANIFQGKFWMHSQGIMILSQVSYFVISRNNAFIEFLTLWNRPETPKYDLHPVQKNGM